MPPILHIEQTASTNSYLKELLLKGQLEAGTVIFTHKQTAGRGQRGTTWESEEGKNLTFSVLLYPTFIPIQKQFILSQIVSLSIKRVLDEYTQDITIKWPNDIYWKKKKICGILIENTLSENKIANTIIGIGLNINQEQFTSNAPNPTSLKLITGKEFDLEYILEKIRNNILAFYQDVLEMQISSIEEEYKINLFRKDGYHLYSEGEKEFEAKIVDVESTGHLVLETKDGKILKFAFKEVRYII